VRRNSSPIAATLPAAKIALIELRLNAQEIYFVHFVFFQLPQ
jgi:hypothetical protein